jgi:hypothetical protein
MNTGMQDAFNLAWKLALVCHGLSTAPELLDSYSVERKAVGASVIQSSGRLTKAAMLHGHTAQSLRNLVAHAVMGLSPVRRAIVEAMAEISIGYPESPLNGPASGEGLAVGARARPLADEPPYGSGNLPRFSLRAEPGQAEEIAARYPRLVEAGIRPASPGEGIELVRPDGYVAASASSSNWEDIVAYLDSLDQPTTGAPPLVPGN